MIILIQRIRNVLVRLLYNLKYFCISTSVYAFSLSATITLKVCLSLRTILKGTGEGLEERSMDITSFLTVDICLSGSYYVDYLSKACNLPI